MKDTDPFNRRQFLQFLGATSAALTLGPVLTACDSVPDGSSFDTGSSSNPEPFVQGDNFRGWKILNVNPDGTEAQIKLKYDGIGYREVWVRQISGGEVQFIKTYPDRSVLEHELDIFLKQEKFLATAETLGKTPEEIYYIDVQGRLVLPDLGGQRIENYIRENGLGSAQNAYRGMEDAIMRLHDVGVEQLDIVNTDNAVFNPKTGQWAVIDFEAAQVEGLLTKEEYQRRVRKLLTISYDEWWRQDGSIVFYGQEKPPAPWGELPPEPPRVVEEGEIVFEDQPSYIVSPRTNIIEGGQGKLVRVMTADGNTWQVRIPGEITYETLEAAGVKFTRPSPLMEKATNILKKFGSVIEIGGYVAGVALAVNEGVEATGIGSSMELRKATFTIPPDMSQETVQRLVDNGTERMLPFYQFEGNFQTVLNVRSWAKLFSDSGACAVRVLDDPSQIHVPLVTPQDRLDTGVVICVDGSIENPNRVIYFHTSTGQVMEVVKDDNTWVPSGEIMYPVEIKGTQGDIIDVLVKLTIQMDKKGKISEVHTPYKISIR